MSAIAFNSNWTSVDKDKLEDTHHLCIRVGYIGTNAIILINASTQRLHLILDNRSISYPISTAKNGLGEIEGSEQTPRGLHSIVEKIGDGDEPDTVFQSREKVETRANFYSKNSLETPKPSSQIVARILRLEGLEPGINSGLNKAGANVDSYNRYIYIHGTNLLADLGANESRGCIRMHPKDVIELFNQVPTSSIVYIYN